MRYSPRLLYVVPAFFILSGLRAAGAERGPHLLRDIQTAPNSDQGSWPENLCQAGSTIYFSAKRFRSGNALWKADGTEAGTVMVKAITPDVGDAAVLNCTPQGHSVIFVTRAPGSVSDLWRSDGTAAGTVPLFVGYNPSRYSEAPMLTWNGRVYFPAEVNGTGFELWSTGGTPEGTRMVKDRRPGIAGGHPNSYAAMDGALYFLGFSLQGNYPGRGSPGRWRWRRVARRGAGAWLISPGG